MPDMLVKLYELPDLAAQIREMHEKEITIRRPLPHEAGKVRRFVEEQFGSGWAEEIGPGFANKPVSLFIATKQGQVIGFAAYECTQRGFFGPTGVLKDERGQGIGKALLIVSMYGLKELGYAYGIIGGAGPTQFYALSVGAVEIPGSSPGVYIDPLR